MIATRPPAKKSVYLKAEGSTKFSCVSIFFYPVPPKLLDLPFFSAELLIYTARIPWFDSRLPYLINIRVGSMYW